MEVQAPTIERDANEIRIFFPKQISSIVSVAIRLLKLRANLGRSQVELEYYIWKHKPQLRNTVQNPNHFPKKIPGIVSVAVGLLKPRAKLVRHQVELGSLHVEV